MEWEQRKGWSNQERGRLAQEGKKKRGKRRMAATDARQQLKIGLGLQQRLPEDGGQLDDLAVLLAHLADHRAGCALASVQDVAGVPGISKKRKNKNLTRACPPVCSCMRLCSKPMKIASSCHSRASVRPCSLRNRGYSCKQEMENIVKRIGVILKKRESHSPRRALPGPARSWCMSGGTPDRPARCCSSWEKPPRRICGTARMRGSEYVLWFS